MLVLSSVMAWGGAASAQTGAPSQIAQAPAQPTAPAAPASPAPAAPGAQAAPQTDTAVGSVATLKGGATVTRDNATGALAVNDAIFKGDVLQTGSDGTLGITFDDETTFTLKPNARIAVDEFVYRQGGTGNAAAFNVLLGTVAFVAAEVAHSGTMRIDTPTSSLGIRGTTGVVEVPADGAAAGGAGAVSIKLYPDVDGRVGRIEVFGRDGAQLGVLSRGATGFAVRPGAAGRFAAVPLQISAREAARDRAVVRATFTTRTVGRQINVQRRTQPPQQRGTLRPIRPPRSQPQPGQQRPGALPGRGGRPPSRTVPGGQPLPSHGALPPQPGAHAPLPLRPHTTPSPTPHPEPGVVPPGGRPTTPTLQPRPRLPIAPRPPRAPAAPKKPPPGKKGKEH
jgi:hypothetical protein